MVHFRSLASFALLSVTVGLTANVNAFQIYTPLPNQKKINHSTFTSRLYAKSPEFSRRELTTQVTSSVLATSATTAIATTLLSEQAFAEDDVEEGRLIEFQVSNLDGVEGNTGTFVIRTRPSWAPKGVQRFEELTEKSFWDDCRIFRVLPGFVAQFGINGTPETQATWRSRNLSDDPVKVTNSRGTVVFATAGPNTRTTQIFINTNPKGNGFLDRQGFSPIGEVVSGMDVVDRFYAGYGEGAPQGKGPNQGLLQAKGNAYVAPSFPKLSYFSKASFK